MEMFNQYEEEETQIEHTYIKYEDLQLRLAPRHSLWSHCLWNASKCLYQLIKNNTVQVQGKSVYEMGCGAAILSIISAKHGASYIVASECPDKELLENVQYNLNNNLTSEQILKVEVDGHYWGSNMPQKKFDLIFQCDLVFNHVAQQQLIYEIQNCLTPAGECHVLFTCHRPKLEKMDFRFVDWCKEQNLKIEEKEKIKMERMFPEDDEFFDIPIREIVHWFVIRL